MIRRMSRGLGVLLGVALIGGLQASSWATNFPSTADEVKLGAQIAKDIDSHYKLVADPVQLARLHRVADALVKVVERQDLVYHFQIVDTPVVNSFAIPGGWVYVTEGMMRFVRTDDELAAVLAHELTHINHRHYYIQQERLHRMSPALILAAALSVLARSPAPLIGEQVAAQGAMSTYQRDLEKDADLHGTYYLTKTAYSPVAMLTLMEHLAQVERLSGQPDDMGIYQDHPDPNERVAYIRADLQRLGIPVVRRIPEGYLRITLDPPAPAGDGPVTIQVDGRPVLTIGATVNGEPPAGRVQAVVARLNAFFDRDPAPYDVRATSLLDRWSVIGDESVLFEVTPQDAAYARLAPEALAAQVRSRLTQVIDAAPYNRKY